jgi:hypothetical protein
MSRGGGSGDPLQRLAISLLLAALLDDHDPQCHRQKQEEDACGPEFAHASTIDACGRHL